VSDHEWKRKRGFLNKALERAAELPVNAVTRGRPLTTSAKRKLYEQGIKGQALVVEGPPKAVVSEVQESEWRFKVRVELPERDSYEASVFQSFVKWEWEALQEGALVECRVDPGDPNKILLCPPEQDEPQLSVLDSSSILERGKRAEATVTASARLGKTAPGTRDEIYLLNLELSSDQEAASWKVQIGQRVPEGAEEMVAPGARLTAAYLEVDAGDSVAIDWPQSSGGSYS
jgi:hypothetical protein